MILATSSCPVAALGLSLSQLKQDVYWRQPCFGDCLMGSHVARGRLLFTRLVLVRLSGGMPFILVQCFGRVKAVIAVTFYSGL